MKVGKTEIIAVVDKSGSMALIKDDAIGSLNQFIKDQQQQPGECLFSYTLFDTTYHLVHQGIRIQDMPFLSNTSYVPGGMTALLDAIGRTVDEVTRRLDRTPENEKPEQVVLVILTDGEENMSREYDWSQVSAILKEKIRLGWKIIFLAQGLESKEMFRNMGIDITLPNVFVSNLTSGGKGYSRGVRAASYAVSSTRSSGHIDKGGTEALLATEETTSPPRPNRATGRGIARAQAERDKKYRRRRPRSDEPDFD